MEALVMAAQLILGLSILVGLHELGHLFAAKFFGMRVEQYSIGFPPKLFSFKYGETEYSLSAIPLGGFVKISGMVDESLDTDQLSKEPEPWEFRAKPAWQRLIVMMGGIIVNVITGVIIFICLIWAYGETYLPKEEVNKYGIEALEIGEDIGLKDGDKIVNINGEDFKRFTDLQKNVMIDNGSYYTVLRDGQEVRVDVPSDMIDRMADKEKGFLSIRYEYYPFKIGAVAEESAAEAAGLMAGDAIVSISDQPVKVYGDLKEALEANKGQTVAMIIDREGEQVQMEAKVSEDGKLGFFPAFDLPTVHEDFTLGQSIPKGANMAFNFLWMNVKGLGKIFSGDVSPTNSVSGPMGIAKIFGGTWDWYNFWRVVGLLSMILAFMNFLPIPALDGGHVMFLTYEMISGKAPSDKFLEVAQKVGMVLLLSIMVFAIGNDIFKEFFN